MHRKKDRKKKEEKRKQSKKEKEKKEKRFVCVGLWGVGTELYLRANGEKPGCP